MSNHSELSINDTSTLCQHYLNIVYRDVHRPLQQHHLSETQGEILYPGVDKLLSMSHLSEQDVFVDLGSGAGKIVVQAFLNSKVKEALGIEFVPELHQQALTVAERIAKELPDFYLANRKLTFMLNNFLEVPLTTATVALINATCMSQQTLTRLGNIFNRNTNIHTVMTLRPIHNLRRLPFKRTVRIECSWDTVLCYVYQR